MRQYSDFEVEGTIKATVHEMVDSATPPPLEESWARFEKKIKKQQCLSIEPRKTEQRNLFLSKLAVAAVIFILLIGAFSISFPTKARAIGGKFVSSVENLLVGTQMNIKTGYKYSEPGRIPSPPEDFKEVPIEQERIVSLEEARSTSPFPITIPQYVPNGYKLDQIKFQKMVKDTAMVSTKYSHPNSNYFLISEMNAPDGYVQGYGYDIEDAIVQDIMIENSKGKIITFKNGSIKITWIRQGIVYEVEGTVLKEDALKIVESMR